MGYNDILGDIMAKLAQQKRTDDAWTAYERGVANLPPTAEKSDTAPRFVPESENLRRGGRYGRY